MFFIECDTIFSHTTQTAYKLLALSKRNKTPTCSTNRSYSQIWKRIWSLQVPYKVKHIIWRAANEALPTLYNLQQRRVIQTAYCPNCKAVCEDIVHALWGCHWLYVIWEANVEVMKCTKHKFSAFADLLDLLFSLRDRTDVNLLCIIMWLIWNRRNLARVGDPIVEYHHIQAKAEKLLLEFQSAQVQEQRVQTACSRAVRWMPPISPLFKMNFDRALFSDLGAAGLGVVIRDSSGHDSSGQVVGALAKRIPIPKSAAIVEALTCRRALNFAKELSTFDVVCEGDAEVIIRALLSREVVHPEYGHVLQYTLVLENDFRVRNFVHVKRVGNSVTHFLARRSKSGNEL